MMPSKKPPVRRRWTKVAASVTMLTVVSTAGWAGFLRLTGNVHEIDRGIAYRSAQLSTERLGRLLVEKHLRAVINLRGPSPGSQWYEDELNVTKQSGAQHFDLALSANVEPNDTLVAQLRTLLRTVPRPFLIHCEGGADRSGLASALYDLDVRGLSADEADRELSFRFGHFPWLTSKTSAMDRTFWRVIANRDSTITARRTLP
jgi:protein tyrosine/serine phosphatase